MNKLSIIMATYNGEQYLREQIDSILNSNYQDFVLHVFDDGSTDKTKDIVREYVASHPNQVVLHENPKNVGVVKNFLHGITEVDSMYYMLCDQDDVWCPDKIEKTLASMEEAEKETPDTPIVVFGDAKVVDKNLVEIARSFHHQGGLNPDLTDLGHLLMENKLIGCTIMFNLKLQKMLFRFPEEIRLHDWWIALVATTFGRIVYLDEPLLLYRQHEDNVVGNESKWSYYRNRFNNLKSQREVLLATEKQAEAFLRVYGRFMERKDAKKVFLFANLYQMKRLRRKYLVLHNGYLKSDFARNIGVLLLV